MTKYLSNLLEAGYAIQRFTTGKTLDDYRRDDLLLSAVERKFVIIGETANRIRRIDATIEAHLSSLRDIIRFRNQLAHGYDTIDAAIIWDIITLDLPILIQHVEALLELPAEQ